MENIRRYRVELDNPSEFLNNQSKGISLFDLLGTFIVAYILESYIINFFKINKDTYYLSLIPVGILIHYLTKQDTFLNVHLMNNEINVYKVILFIILYYLYKSLN